MDAMSAWPTATPSRSSIQPCDAVGITLIDAANSFVPGTWTVAAVPEPSTYALLLAGLALVGFSAKRHMSMPH